MIKILVLSFLLIFTEIGVAQENRLVFSDSTEISPVSEAELEIRYPENKLPKTSSRTKIKIIKKEFTGNLRGFGKAFPPLSKSTLRKIAVSDKSLAAKFRKIHTAYNVRQGNADYYFSGLNSIDFQKIADCSSQKSCKAVFGATIVQLTRNGETENILIITSLEIIK